MQLQWWVIWRYARIVAVEIAIKTVIKAIANCRETEFRCFNEIRPLRSLSRKARNFSGPKANFKIKICSIVAQFGHKPVNFASLTDSFVLTFSNYWTLILNINAANRKQLSGPEKNYWDFRETGLCVGDAVPSQLGHEHPYIGNRTISCKSTLSNYPNMTESLSYLSMHNYYRISPGRCEDSS